MSLDIDPDKSADVTSICKQSKTSNFDNDQLAEIVNTKFQKYGLSSCRISVLNNVGSIQLKDQCPSEYKNVCLST